MAVSTPPTRDAASSTPVPTASGDGSGDVAGNKATARVLLVLNALLAGPGSHGVSDLGRRLGMTKNMVHRALETLERHGYVIRDATGSRYQLGPGVFQLGSTGLPDLYLPELCDPFMRRIRDLTGETVTLAVPRGRQAVTTAGVRGRGVIARRVPLGRILPLHVSPASRAILAAFPDQAIKSYTKQPLEHFTNATLTTPEAVRAEVDAIRERGYATAFDDHWRGGNGAAFAVHAAGEYPHGSVTVAGPAERLTPERLKSFLPELRTIADELNRRSRLYTSEYFEDRE